MTDLNLKELDRLEREMHERHVVGLGPDLFNLDIDELSNISSQLRPLLDLVERMGGALYRITPQRDTRPDLQGFEEAQAVLDDYQRAKGE